MDGHSNSGIHGYLDRGGRGKVSIHEWSMDDTVTLASMDTQTEGSSKVAIHRLSMDGTVTLASTDT